MGKRTPLRLNASYASAAVRVQVASSGAHTHTTTRPSLSVPSYLQRWPPRISVAGRPRTRARDGTADASAIAAAQRHGHTPLPRTQGSE